MAHIRRSESKQKAGPGGGGVFEDLRLIIRAAIAMRSGDDIAYPDGETLWQSLSARRVGH